MGLCGVPVHKLSHLCFGSELSQLFKNQSSCSELMLTTGFTSMYSCVWTAEFHSPDLPWVWRSRATHFSLTSRTCVIHGSCSLPLSFPSAQRLGSTELWAAPWIRVGWFYRLFCLKGKHLAVPLLRDWLSPAQAGLSLWVLPGSSSHGVEVLSFSLK